MEAVAEALWGLADVHKGNGDVVAAVKCLEAICQSQVSFLPMIEVKTQLRVADLLLNHTDHVNHAKSDLERALTDSKSFQTMCQIYAAVSYICMGVAESSSQALDLIGPIYRIMDSFVGVREKTGILLAYGLLQMRQHNLQEARIRLASELRLSHQQLGNIQLVSQYLTVLGSLALALHDTGQAREILKSSLTLAKTLYDVPTQIWILSVFTALYKELGESRNEMENSDYERKKTDDLKKRVSDAESSAHHLELIGMQIDKLKTEVQLHEFDMRQADPGPSMISNLDIPESVDLVLPPAGTSSRLTATDPRRRRA